MIYIYWFVTKVYSKGYKEVWNEMNYGKGDVES